MSILSSYRYDVADGQEFYRRIDQEIERYLSGKAKISGDSITVLNLCTEAEQLCEGKWNILHRLDDRAGFYELKLATADGSDYDHLLHICLRQLQQWTSRERRPVRWIDLSYADEEQGDTLRCILTDTFESRLFYWYPDPYEDDEEEEGEDWPEGTISVAFADEDDEVGMLESEQVLAAWLDAYKENRLEVLLAVDYSFDIIQYWRRLQVSRRIVSR